MGTRLSLIFLIYAFSLHLMSDDQILIVKLIVWTVPHGIRHKSCHFILVKIHFTTIALIIFIIHIIHTCITT